VADYVPYRSGPHACSQRLRKRILIVNCYFDNNSRQPRPRTNKLPKPMGTVYLAGAFSPHRCDVRLYCEMYSGPLDDPHVLAWPDMLVMTGLTTAFDRMLHLAAYARTLNKKVVVVAGGPAIRAFPRYSKLFFDHPCCGDVEELRDVTGAVFGEEFVAEEMFPRFDLAYWIGGVGELESSRNCNFRCSFCTLSAEGRNYQKYDLEAIRRHILAIGKRKLLFFIDNNFYGNERNFFLERADLLREMKSAGQFRGWGAMVTNDFFLLSANLELARESGCVALFSGLESFDSTWLRKMKKLQNTAAPQVSTIRKCLEAGIVFLYGLMVDPTTRSVTDLRAELEFVTGTSEITLPSYISLPVPIPGTPYFHECVSQGLLLPRVALRDLDSTTLVLQPLDSLTEVCGFWEEIRSMRGFRKRLTRQFYGFAKRYGRTMTPLQLAVAFANPALLTAYSALTSPSPWYRLRHPAPRRTYIGGTEPLDITYKPAFPIASRYAHYFRPTMLTDDRGHLTEALAEDLEDSRRKMQPHPTQVSLVSSKRGVAVQLPPAP
jgi:hopanoid C-2 methylase